MFLDYPPVASLIPAALVVLTGLLLRARWTGERRARRWLLYLFGVSVLLGGAQVALLGREADKVLALTQPALVGTLVALLVHLGSTGRLWSKHDRYPPRLASLVPFYLWYVPQPVILTDQTWCYQGGETHYRLGYVHRPAYGTPRPFISIHLYASAGEPPDPGWPCDGELERARASAPP